jgi:hypothetical protein
MRRRLTILASSSRSVGSDMRVRRIIHVAPPSQLYTKAYELFKKKPIQNETQTHGRLTLFIAYRIAQTHCESGKFDVAIRWASSPTC